MPHARFQRSFAVIDASCLICLLHLNQSLSNTDFITALALHYQAVYIPRHVLEEVRRKGRIRHRIRELVQQYPVLEICDITNRYDTQLLYDRQLNPAARIHRGEAEVIIQAREREVSEVLMDDKRGREMAKLHTLMPKGTAKLLIDFKRVGVQGADEVKPLLQLLRKAGKLQITEDLLDELLEEAGES